MKLRTMVLSLAAVGIPVAAGAAENAALQGQAYRQTLESSRFDVGANAREESVGLYRRVSGEKGAFLVDTVTGASLAVPSFASSDLPKGMVASLPQPLTKDPQRHSAVVRDYLLRAGIPAAEVGGTHVTTTMAGSGSEADGVVPSRSTLLWYTTHLERSLGGVPVEGSYAYTSLDRDGKVISEGVYWPPISADVVGKAAALQQRLAAPASRAKYLEQVKAVSADVAAAADDGEVRIVHTSSGYHGVFEAKAVYSVIVRTPLGDKGRGKARILRFDPNGKALTMADEVAAGVDSPKR